jgi:hypothetical protein
MPSSQLPITTETELAAYRTALQELKSLILDYESDLIYFHDNPAWFAGTQYQLERTCKIYQEIEEAIKVYEQEHCFCSIPLISSHQS